jgi:protein TonB
MNALMKEQIHYPQEAYDLGIDGKCYLRFVVEADGSVGDVSVLRGVTDCPECDKEAIRFMKNLPLWIPGTVDGKPVVTHFNIYIHFNLY